MLHICRRMPRAAGIPQGICEMSPLTRSATENIMKPAMPMHGGLPMDRCMGTARTRITMRRYAIIAFNLARFCVYIMGKSRSVWWIWIPSGERIRERDGSACST